MRCSRQLWGGGEPAFVDVGELVLGLGFGNGESQDVCM